MKRGTLKSKALLDGSIHRVNIFKGVSFNAFLSGGETSNHSMQPTSDPHTKLQAVRPNYSQNTAQAAVAMGNNLSLHG